jgi:hypothetical protein
MGFYWQFLLQMARVQIGPATELQELRALPYRRHRAGSPESRKIAAGGKTRDNAADEIRTVFVVVGS